MSDRIVQMTGYEGSGPVPVLASDNGDGTFTLATYQGGSGATDRLIQYVGFNGAGPVPVLAHDNGDGTYALGTYLGD